MLKAGKAERFIFLDIMLILVTPEFMACFYQESHILKK